MVVGGKRRGEGDAEREGRGEGEGEGGERSCCRPLLEMGSLDKAR
jgi:hypothetical protein